MKLEVDVYEEKLMGMLSRMKEGGVLGIRDLGDAYLKSKGANRAGYEYQIEMSYEIWKTKKPGGGLKAVEFKHIDSKRADCLLQSGALAEIKNTQVWLDAWKQFAAELAAYAKHGANLYVITKHELPLELKAMVQYYKDKGGALKAQWFINGVETQGFYFGVDDPLDSDPKSWYEKIVKQSEEWEEDYQKGCPDYRGRKVYS